MVFDFEHGGYLSLRRIPSCSHVSFDDSFMRVGACRALTGSGIPPVVSGLGWLAVSCALPMLLDLPCGAPFRGRSTDFCCHGLDQHRDSGHGWLRVCFSTPTLRKIQTAQAATTFCAFWFLKSGVTRRASDFHRCPRLPRCLSVATRRLLQAAWLNFSGPNQIPGSVVQLHAVRVRQLPLN